LLQVNCQPVLISSTCSVWTECKCKFTAPRSLLQWTKLIDSIKN